MSTTRAINLTSARTITAPARSGGWFAFLADWEAGEREGWQRVRFYGQGESAEAARRELAQAVGAWEEDRAERRWEGERAQWDLMKEGGAA